MGRISNFFRRVFKPAAQEVAGKPGVPPSRQDLIGQELQKGGRVVFGAPRAGVPGMAAAGAGFGGLYEWLESKGVPRNEVKKIQVYSKNLERAKGKSQMDLLNFKEFAELVRSFKENVSGGENPETALKRFRQGASAKGFDIDAYLSSLSSEPVKSARKSRWAAAQRR
ncbi:hypothetical protein HZB89_00585 [archaeon]|nr:hypothetical protein [archaeon]